MLFLIGSALKMMPWRKMNHVAHIIQEILLNSLWCVAIVFLILCYWQGDQISGVFMELYWLARELY